MHRNVITETARKHLLVRPQNWTLVQQKLEMHHFAVSCGDVPWKGCVTMVAQERAIISLEVWRKQEIRDDWKFRITNPATKQHISPPQ